MFMYATYLEDYAKINKPFANIHVILYANYCVISFLSSNILDFILAIRILHSKPFWPVK